MLQRRAGCTCRRPPGLPGTRHTSRHTTCPDTTRGPPLNRLYVHAHHLHACSVSAGRGTRPCTCGMQGPPQLELPREYCPTGKLAHGMGTMAGHTTPEGRAEATRCLYTAATGSYGIAPRMHACMYAHRQTSCSCMWPLHQRPYHARHGTGVCCALARRGDTRSISETAAYAMDSH